MLVTCAQAKAAGLAHYFTGKPCRSGHVAERLVINRVCLECARLSAARYRVENPEKIAAAKRVDYSRQQAKYIANSRRWRAQNSDESKAASKQWRINNRAAVRAHIRRRGALRRKAAPAWANKNAIKQIYLFAEWVEFLKGTPMHVDHIIPLKHPLVCGLHIETNLQALPADANRRKHNHFDPEDPIHATPQIHPAAHDPVPALPLGPDQSSGQARAA